MKLGRRGKEDGNDKMKAYDRTAMKEEGGGGLLWQRSILLGERCQRPDFSGIIIYDDMGKRLPEFPPRSPRHNIFHPSVDQGNPIEKR
jgi:hypothetical protein